MRRALSSEWLKLRATPTMWWLLLGVVGIGIAATLGAVVLDNARHIAATGDQALRDDMHSAGTGSILVVVAGIIAAAGEFRFGQADQTFISEPRRFRVVAAKAVIYAGVGTVFGVIASLAGLATTAVWLGTKGLSLPLGREAVWLTVIGAIASAILFAVLGVGIGGAARNQVTAVVATLAWFVIAEPIAKQISDPVARWFPGNAAFALRRVPETGLLSMRTGALVLCVWTLAALAAGLTRTVREDVT